jgi:hypothetical protein
MVVLSLKTQVAARFRQEDEASFAERALAAGSHGLLPGIPDGTKPMLEEAMSPDVLERLKTVPSFKARYDQAKAEGRAEGKAEVLLRYFRARHDTPSASARAVIETCSDPALLDEWLDRAYAGETSAHIFGSR